MNSDSLRRDGTYHDVCGYTYSIRHDAISGVTRMICDACHVEVRADGWAGWPSRPAEPQHDYEPPRVLRTKVPNRAARLKALGNLAMPRQFAPVFAAIVAAEMELRATAGMDMGTDGETSDTDDTATA